MPVPIQPSRPKEQHDGLLAIEADILKQAKGETIVAIVTYVRKRRVEDDETDDYYPVLKTKHIEPMLGALKEQAEKLQAQGYQARTGENELDLDFDGDEAGDE